MRALRGREEEAARRLQRIRLRPPEDGRRRRGTGPESLRARAVPTSAGEWETVQNRLGKEEGEEAGQP